MPYAPNPPCRHPRCAALASAGTGWCVAHRPVAIAEIAARRARTDLQRGSAAARGYDASWGEVSRAFRARFPVSAGYLVRSPDWSETLAAQFHRLRIMAWERGEWLRFLEADGAGIRFMAEFPIYELRPSARVEPAQVVDHIVPHRGNSTLMWSEWNFQALSKRQHDQKTAREGKNQHGTA